MHSNPRSFLTVASLVVLAGVASAGAAPQTSEAVAVQLRDQAMSGQSTAYAWVSDLTTRIGPRPAGSANEHQAADWAAGQLRAYGFDNVQVQTFPITAWSRGVEHAELVAPNKQPLFAVALGESPPTPAEGLDGEVVVFPTFDDLIAAPKGSLAGKIAMVARHMVRTQNGAGYGPVVAARANGPGEAAQRGAIAFLMRSAGTDEHRMGHTGTTKYVNGHVPIPAFALSTPDADQIERLAAAHVPVRVHVYSGSSYDPAAHSQNVIAEIRGRERPDEVVLLGAHLDSWDLGTGAIDDAAGTAIVTAAAKLIHDLPQRPKRTVRVVLFGSEEIAQPQAPFMAFGGHAYADTHKAQLPSHVLAGESDFGADRVYELTLPKGFEKGEFASTALRVLAPIGVIAAPTPSDDVGTDVEPSVQAGVPAFALAQDGTRYFDLHHTADDTLDKIDRQQLDQNVAAWAALIWLAADTDVDFRKSPAPH